MENKTKQQQQANKTAVLKAFWENPERVFNFPFRENGKMLSNLKADNMPAGAIRLSKNEIGAEIVGVRVFGNSGSGIAGIATKGKPGIELFDYLETYILHTVGYWDTLQKVAELCGVKIEFSKEEHKKIRREQLARELIPSFIEALRKNPNGETATYLTGVRGLQPDGVHFGELTADSLKNALELLKNKNITYNNDDLTALHLTTAKAAAGYTLVMPYYRNGRIVGLKLRNTRKGFTGNKYLNPDEMETGGYCDALTPGEPALLVEGEMDAIRLIQAGQPNVVALCGATLNDTTARVLKSRGITDVTYIPDHEFTPDQKPIKSTIQQAVDSLLTKTVDDERVIRHVKVAELPTPADMFTSDKYKISKSNGELKKYKTDADTFVQDGGNITNVLADAVPWWAWELGELTNTAIERETAQGENATTTPEWFADHFDAIYNRVTSPYDREQLKRYITTQPEYEQLGITPDVLDDVDGLKRIKQYNDAVRAAASDLNKAVENGANPVQVGEAVAKLSEAQGQNTRDEWNKQLNQTFADELDAIRNQPDTLKTNWKLGGIMKSTKTFKAYAGIEYWPADITVYCAATSHGKTAVLFQSAFDLIKREPNKTYLYVSCEENKRQLIERALNVYIDIQTTEDGRTVEAPNVEPGQYCFIEQTRKKTIKAVLRGDVAPDEYTGPGDIMGNCEHYNALTKQIQYWVRRYEQEIRPRLLFVHTDGTAESIAANVEYFARKYEREGVEIGGVFIDYMQLLTSDAGGYSRHDELKDVCKALKRVAANTELPVIIASQLNRNVIVNGIDAVTLANLAEGADIERIAHDVYLIWQTDKTKVDEYLTYPKNQKPNNNEAPEPVPVWDYAKAKDRANRIFYKNELRPNQRTLKEGYLYIEQMKARDGKTGVWGLFPFDGERGHIGGVDENIAMK